MMISKRLHDRLLAAAQQIRSKTHAGIGFDHGGLLVSLVKSGRVDYGIATDDKQVPFGNSVQGK